MKIYDISMQIEKGMIVYKNKETKQPIFEITRTIEEGACESRISIDSQSGTGVDAPSHMIKGGANSDKYDLLRFIGKCRVLDLTKSTQIAKKDLEIFNIKKGERILLKTKNSKEKKWNPNFVTLSSEAALYLAKIGIALFGFDWLGIEINDPKHLAHKALLGNGIPIVEGLRLANVNPGEYFLSALPLKLKLDGSPIRAVLIPLKEVNQL